MLELEIDKHLLDHLVDGKASCLVTASDRSVVDILMKRYEAVGWIVNLAYWTETGNLFRVVFEDPDQVEITKKVNFPRPPPTSIPGRPIPSGFFAKPTKVMESTAQEPYFDRKKAKD